MAYAFFFECFSFSFLKIRCGVNWWYISIRLPEKFPHPPHKYCYLPWNCCFLIANSLCSCCSWWIGFYGDLIDYYRCEYHRYICVDVNIEIVQRLYTVRLQMWFEFCLNMKLLRIIWMNFQRTRLGLGIPFCSVYWLHLEFHFDAMEWEMTKMPMKTHSSQQKRKSVCVRCVHNSSAQSNWFQCVFV